MFVDIRHDKIEKVKDAEAIDNQLHNILSLMLYDVEGMPWLGFDLRILFENINDGSIIVLKNNIRTLFEKWILRANLIELDIKENMDYNEVVVTITYEIKKSKELVEFIYINKM